MLRSWICSFPDSPIAPLVESPRTNEHPPTHAAAPHRPWQSDPATRHRQNTTSRAQTATQRCTHRPSSSARRPATRHPAVLISSHQPRTAKPHAAPPSTAHAPRRWLSQLRHAGDPTPHTGRSSPTAPLDQSPPRPTALPPIATTNPPTAVVDGRHAGVSIGGDCSTDACCIAVVDCEDPKERTVISAPRARRFSSSYERATGASDQHCYAAPRTAKTAHRRAISLHALDYSGILDIIARRNFGRISGSQPDRGVPA